MYVINIYIYIYINGLLQLDMLCPTRCFSLACRVQCAATVGQVKSNALFQFDMLGLTHCFTSTR